MAAKRLLAVLATLVAGALGAAIPIGASPAMAEGDGLSVRLSMPDEVHAGGEPVVMMLTVENTTDNEIRPIHTFSVNLPGLKASEAKFFHNDVGVWKPMTLRNQGGSLRTTDPSRIEVPPHSQMDLQYALQLLSTAPSGDLRVTITATAGRDIKQDTDSESAKVVGGFGEDPSPTPSAEPTDVAPSVIETPADPPGTGLDNASGNDSTGSSVPWLAYGIGIVLVLGGAGLFAFLWFNRGPEPAHYYEPEQDPTLIRRAPPRVYGGGPVPHQPVDPYDSYLQGQKTVAPTQQFPAVGRPPRHHPPQGN